MVGMAPKYLYFKKALGFLEQVQFSALSFILVAVMGRILDEELFVDFVEVFSIVSLAYLIYGAIVVQPYYSFAALERRDSINKNQINFEVIIGSFLLSFILAIICRVILGFSVIQIVNLVFLAVGWSVADLFRRGNMIRSADYLNVIYISLSYVLAGIFVYFIGVPQFLPAFLGGALITMVIPNVLKNPSKPGVNRLLISKYWKFGYPLLVGSFLFWGYTQGLYLMLVKLFNPGEVGDLRVIQNLTGLISVPVLFYENRYLLRLAAFNEDGCMSKDCFQKDVKRYLLALLAVISVIGFMVFIVGYYVYGFGESKIKFYFLFSVLNLIYFSTRPIVVLLKVKAMTSRIRSAHLYAFFACFLFGGGATVWLGSNALLVWFISPCLVFSLYLFVVWCRNEKVFTV